MKKLFNCQFTLTISPIRFSFILVDLLECLKTVVHQFDRLVHVWLRHIVSEVEFGHRLGYSDNGEQRPGSYIHVTYLLLTFPLELSLLDVSCYDVLMEVVWNHGLVGLCFGDE